MKKRILVSLAIALLLVATIAMPALALVEQTTLATLSVSSTMSITLTGSIAFGDVAPGTTEQGATGQISGTPAITVNIGSETNELVDIGIKGAITSGTLALANWEYSQDFAKATIAPLTTSYVAVYTDVDDDVTSSEPFYHWITVPVGTDAGDHTVTVSYKIVTANDPFE